MQQAWLQKVEIDLLNAVKLYDDCLITFLFQIRDRLYEMGEKPKSYVESTNTKKQHVA